MRFLILRVSLVLGVASILEIRPASLDSFGSVNSGGELRFPEATAAERKMLVSKIYQSV